MSLLLNVIVVAMLSWALFDGFSERQEQWANRLLGVQNGTTLDHRVFVTIRNDMDLSYYERIEVTKNLGTSNYIRFLDGLISEVDGANGYWVDHSDADIEHHQLKFGDAT